MLLPALLADVTLQQVEGDRLKTVQKTLVHLLPLHTRLYVGWYTSSPSTHTYTLAGTPPPPPHTPIRWLVHLLPLHTHLYVGWYTSSPSTHTYTLGVALLCQFPPGTPANQLWPPGTPVNHYKLLWPPGTPANHYKLLWPAGT